MVRLTYLLVLSFFLTSNFIYGQTSEEFEATYAKRIKEEMLNGVYIPADLEDAYTELSRLADPQGLLMFKSAPEDSIRHKLHFGFGKWIMTNWELEEGSRISHYLKMKGVSYPDDMVRVIIVTWHRRLNGHPLKLEEEIAEAKLHMEAEKAKRDKDKKVIVLEKRPHKE
ncbi:MAG TPA: DUF6794 domain-containing protein [Saprospiraceae bacterium]|nr:DUF6794 domain-containing protein [Saprospiraceae bacterium]